MSYKLISASSDLPVSSTGFTQAINFYVSGKDETIDLMLKAAIIDAQDYSGLSLYDSEWEMQLENFKEIIQIEKYPVTGIDSVKYFDSSNNEITMVEGTDFNTDIVSEPARIKFINTPDVYSHRLDAVRIRFRTGYANGIPEDLKAAIYMAAGAYMINPTDAVRQFPTASKNLLRNHRKY